MRCINPEHGILLITRSGIVLRTELDQIRETGRSTQGVRLMNIAKGDELVGVAVLKEVDKLDEFEDETTEPPVESNGHNQ
jgi:DNA gyrase subunit A